MRRSTIFKLLGAVVALFLALGVAEVGLRLLGYGPRPWGATAAGYFWVADTELGFRNRPDGSFRNRAIVGQPLVTTDDQGFRRGLGWDGGEGVPAVVMVGDSTTFCAEVGDDRTAASELARQLGGKVQVLNAGVAGYSTVQARRMLRRCLELYPSIRVAVHMHCGNDLVENLNPVVYHPAWAPTVRWDAGANAFVDVPPAVAPEAAGRPVAPPAVGRLHLALHRLGQGSAVARLTEAVARRALGLAPVYGPTVELESGAVGPVFVGTERWQQQVEWALQNRGVEAVQAELQAMDAMCRERGVTLLVTEYEAGRGGGSGELDLARLSHAAGVRFVDLRPAFPGPPQGYRARQVTGDLDPHWGAEGTRAFAAAMAPEVATVLEADAPSE